MLWLVGEPSFSRLLTVELWLSFLYGSYNGAMCVLDGDHADRRSNFWFLARYSLAMPSLALYTGNQHLLDHLTGNRAIPDCGCPLRGVDL